MHESDPENRPDPRSVRVRDAATVMVLRDGPDRHAPLEVLMLRRASTMSFVANAMVFPGGALDEADGPGTHGLTMAAIRETFEEAGLVLAADVDGRPAGATHQEQLAGHRHHVHRGAVAFGDVLGGAGLRAAVDAVHPWGRWVTPLGSHRRYDTRFFVTACPEGQEAEPDSHESVEHRWITPRQALRAGEEGSMLLILPTRKSLEALTRFPTAAAALDAAARSRHWSVPAVIPAAG